MKVVFSVICVLFSFLAAYGSGASLKNNEGVQLLFTNDLLESSELAEQNIIRAMNLFDTAMASHFEGEEMAMSRFYNPFTNTRSDEKGSVWMYTAVIESVVAIMEGLEAHHVYGNGQLYEDNYYRYAALLKNLYENLSYYQGTFRLVSYTQTRDWTVFGVHRSNTKGTAKVDGIENVYDDQQWLVRELIQAYELTGDDTYLNEAEYLTAYVLDGWDSTLDEEGNEHGGIPWGPGYVTKHACSNGPMISPLVWLHELYRDSSEEISYRYILPNGQRATASMKKSDYYLKFAEAIYDWQKEQLLRDDGVYHDMRGGCGDCEITYESVDGVEYRAHTALSVAVGRAYSYNAGTMLSGAADLFRATANSAYLNDLKVLSGDSFAHFAQYELQVPGYYTYATDGFNNWFNGVLVRAYIDAYPVYQPVGAFIATFQQNLDYGYQNHLYKGHLPPDLLRGWESEDRNMEGMSSFTYAAEYALLARYTLAKAGS